VLIAAIGGARRSATAIGFVNGFARGGEMKGYCMIKIAVLSTILFACGDDRVLRPVTVVHVPDSGQTQSYTSVFGQDSDYQLHPPSYSDNSNGTITDNVTGLMWQREYNASEHYDSEAEGYCAGLSLAGFFDWRTPSDFELMTIVDYGSTAPAINATYFPNTRTEFYWTLTDAKTSTFFTSRWGVDFQAGNLGTPSTFKKGYTRCVRGGQNQPRVFKDRGTGTITDMITKLVWQKHDQGATVVWEEAIKLCEELILGGFFDWRLPNVKELRSIVDSGTYAPAAFTVYFPGTWTDSYWSSTTYVASPSSAWLVNFWHGEVDASSKGNAFFVRCVRGGE
jgi:hypothetical protein